MKNRYFLVLFLLTDIVNSFEAKAQDKNAQAIVSYTKAEEFYNSEKYDSCVEELTYTENILGETNSKILYLKTKAGLKLCDSDFELYQEDSLIKKFFAITHVQDYPSDKYAEIINAKREFEAIASTRNPIFLKRNLAELPLSETLNDLKYLMPRGDFSNINDKNSIVEITIEKPLFKTGRVFWYAIAIPIVKKPSYVYGLIFLNNFIESPLTEPDGGNVLGVKTACDVNGGHVDFYHRLKAYSKHRLAGMGGLNYGAGKEGVVFNTKEIPSENNILYLVLYSSQEQPIKINYFLTTEDTSLDLDKYFSIGGDNLEKLGFDKKNTSYGNSSNYKFVF